MTARRIVTPDSADRAARTAPGTARRSRSSATALQAYLDRARTPGATHRKAELDELDAAALRPAGPTQDDLTDDMLLSMALWKAVADRLRAAARRLGLRPGAAAERERLSTLIWGRLDATLDPAVLAERGDHRAPTSARSRSRCPRPAGSPTRWPASCGPRLALDPAADANAARVTDLRAPLERLRDQVALEPDRQPQRGAQRTSDELGRPDRGRHRARASAAATSAACSARWRTTRPGSSAT